MSLLQAIRTGPLRPALLLIFAGLAGCGHYLTPRGTTSVPAAIGAPVAEAMAAEPAAGFPARLAVARLQGSGSYVGLATRDIETEADLERIAALEGIESIAAMSGLLLPQRPNSTAGIRAAAAGLRADLLLLYTFDSSFRSDTTRLGPLAPLGLGFIPNHKAFVSTICAAAIVDVRTGYIYGTAEASALEEQRSNFWNAGNAVESARFDAERRAFAGLLAEIEQLWPKLLARHSAAP